MVNSIGLALGDRPLRRNSTSNKKERAEDIDRGSKVRKGRYYCHLKVRLLSPHYVRVYSHVDYHKSQDFYREVYKEPF